MAEIDDESVRLIITSPPYWQLKDYGTKNQIGFDDSYEDYINNLNLVWNESYRVLSPGCRLCINIGDQFARSVYYGRYKVIPIRTEIIKFCETIGLDYMGAIIWQKVTTTNTTGGASIFKKPGALPQPPKNIKDKSMLTINEWNKYFAGHWNFNGVRQAQHLAMFPEELPKRLIKMFSFVEEAILDPFLGSGTTTLAAKNLGRNSIGYEINNNFLPLIKEKIGASQKSLFSNAQLEFIKQKKLNPDFKIAVADLPYIFKDPIKITRNINPKKMKFGSKIDSSDFDYNPVRLKESFFK